MKHFITVIIYLIAAQNLNIVVAAKSKKYLMYVWNSGLDIEKCSLHKNKKENPECFSPAWETPEQRANLWASCRIKGREVDRINLSKVKTRIKQSDEGICDAIILETLQEAHDRKIKIYALFATSNEDFSEKEDVSYAVKFNNHCANETAFFDGVAINNEWFSKVRNCEDSNNEEKQLTFLDNLELAKTNAAPLPVHFSLGWSWGWCSNDNKEKLIIQWSNDGINGKRKTAIKHMMDIVDSVDVQVARNNPTEMIERAELAGYSYWKKTQKGKSSTTSYYVLAYINPQTPNLCHLSFSPHNTDSIISEDDCNKGNPKGDRTEVGMWDAFDTVTEKLSKALGGIHYFGGVYSTGITDKWPKHEATASYTKCARKIHRLKYLKWNKKTWTWEKIHRKYKAKLHAKCNNL